MRVKVNILKLFALLLIDYYKPHGYELMKRINELTNGILKPSPGTIYPLLFLLEKQGLIRGVKISSRKKYDLTEQGRKLLYPSLNKLKNMVEELNKIINEELVKQESYLNS